MTTKVQAKQLVFISAGLIVLMAAAFEPLRHNGFVNYDDIDYITKNPYFKSGLTLHSVRWAFTTGHASNWHPLTWLSHMLDIELFGLQPFGHHMHNLLLHTISTLLLFGLLYKTTGAVWRSALTAAIFGIHPLRVESVAWAAERKDVLCTFFFIFTLAAYCWYVKKGGALRYIAVVLCFILGLMSKPMIVTLPIVLLLLDYWPLARITVNGQGFRSIWVSVRPLLLEKIPFFALALISCIITYHVQRHGRSMATTEQYPVLFRALNAGSSYMAYLGKIFWPQNLAVLYPFPETVFPFWSSILSFIFLLFIFILVYFLRSQKPFLFTGWLWYTVTLVPVIGLIQVGSQRMADRYAYLPSIGIFMILGWITAKGVLNKPFCRNACAILYGLFILAMIVMTRSQVSRWRNSLILFEHTLAVTRDNYIIENNLASELIRQKRFQEAYEHVIKSLAIRPDNPWANANMAAILMRRNQPEEALIYISKTLGTEPHNSDALWHKGKILEMLQKNDEAIQAYEQCIQYNPSDAEAFNNLGVLKAQKGFPDNAENYFRQAIQIKPHYADANRNLAVLLQSRGQLEEAFDYYRVVTQTESNDYIAFYAMASISAQRGRLRESVEYYRESLKVKPDLADALNDLAWLLAATQDNLIRNPQEAVNLSYKACELTQFKNPSFLDTLALAYASQEQFDKAVKIAQQGIESANAQGQPELALRIKKRLDLYQNSKPYYEPQPTQ